MKKSIALIIISLSALLTLLAVSASAEIFPEDNIVGETIYIEPDENMIKDNIVNGNPKESFELETGKTLDLDKPEYIESFVMPVIWLSLAGVAIWLVTVGSKHLKEKNLNK